MSKRKPKAQALTLVLQFDPNIGHAHWQVISPVHNNERLSFGELVDTLAAIEHNPPTTRHPPHPIPSE